MIDGVVITPLTQFVDKRGKVMHMLRNDSEVFQSFGEIYFSGVNPGAIKAWHFHKVMTLNYAVPHGSIKFVLFDERDGSPSKGQVQEIYLGHDAYNLVTVPPGIWNGFKGVGKDMALVANCATIPHDPDATLRRDHFDDAIPYDWGIKQD